MSDQYLPWSPILGIYDLEGWIGSDITEENCQYGCDHINARQEYGATDWRPARLYTPDEVTALEQDRERLEWLINNNVINPRCSIDLTMKGGE